MASVSDEKSAGSTKRRHRRLDRPKVRLSPRWIFVGFFLVGIALELAIKTRDFYDIPPHVLYISGGCLAAVGVGLVYWATRLFSSARTPVNTYLSVVHLVQDGPFRYSRNPIYLGLVFVFLGFGLILHGWWTLVLLPFLLLALYVAAIRPEERYLQWKFGETYQRYRNRVRRWL